MTMIKAAVVVLAVIIAGGFLFLPTKNPDGGSQRQGTSVGGALIEDDCSTCILDETDAPDETSATGDTGTTDETDAPEENSGNAGDSDTSGGSGQDSTGGGAWPSMPEPTPMPLQSAQTGTNPVDRFAKCLTSRGATMYSKTGCPYCLQQMRLFGDSFRYIRAFNCADDMAKCKSLKITSTPTWVFAGGTRLIGYQDFIALSESTGCAAPGKL